MGDYDGKHLDEDWLREKYLEERLTDPQIAEMVNRDDSQVYRARQKFGIETRTSEDLTDEEWQRQYGNAHDAIRTLPRLSTNVNGYERIRHCENELKLHRLTAVAWFGWDEVVGNHVHHRNGIKWDNREDNLEPLPPGEHHSIHAKEMQHDDTGKFTSN